MTIFFHFDADGAVTPTREWRLADGPTALCAALDVRVLLSAAEDRLASGFPLLPGPGVARCKLMGGGAEALHDARTDMTVLVVDPAVADLTRARIAELLATWRAGLRSATQARRELMELAGNLDEAEVHLMSVVELERTCGRDLGASAEDAAVPKAA